jgi:nicotinamide mononucleotide adenylyltransferase
MYAHELYEQNKPRVVVTYPGRFQPFHQGHAGVFAQLQKKFGRDSVYILTSNDTSSAKSPFNFSDKYQLMTAAGVPGDKIIETNQMYKLPDSIDAANTIFITAVGAPDADRLNPDTFTKRDQKDKEGNVTKPAGSPSYYKTWGGAETPVTADQHGYVIVIPEIHKEVTIKGQKYDVSHGTECRNLWNSIRNDAKARTEFLSQMYARPSQELAAIFDKIPQATAEDIGSDSQTSTSPIHGTEFKQGVAEAAGEEFEPAPYVFSSIKHAEKEAARKGKKVVRSAGGYFKLVDIDDPAPELIANPNRDQLVATLQNKVNALKDFLKRIKRGTPAFEKFIERGGYGDVNKKIAAINAEISKIPRFVQKNIDSNNQQGMAEDAAGVGVVAKNKKMARDPRYSMSITKDVKPSTPKNMLRAFRLSEESAVSEEQIMSMIKNFLPLATKELKIKKLPKIILKKHIETDDGQATFGRFVNEEEKIYLGIADRHPVDILRTLAHELVHFRQYEQGKMYPGAGDTGSPIENEAHVVAGIIMRHFNKKYPNAVKSPAVALDESLFERYQQFKENGDEADEVKKQKNLIPYPKGTVKVDVSDVYDWYKLGQEISDLDDANPADFGKGPPQTVMAFGSEPEEHRYLKDLKRLGLKTHDIDETYSGPPLKFLRPGELRGSYTDQQLKSLGFKQATNGRWYIRKDLWNKLVANKSVQENFADGRNPQDKGDSKRYNVPTKGKISTLRKIAKQGGRRGQLAHWMANMRSGKNKK